MPQQVPHDGGTDHPGNPGMGRRTFVVQVHADGPSTLEDLSTRERVAVVDLATIGSQIQRWLDRAGFSPRSGRR